MNIPLIRIFELADLLEKDGQFRITPNNEKLGIEIYENPGANGNALVLIPGVIQRPSIGIKSPDDFFKELQKEVEQHLPNIKKLVFEDGGTIPIPEGFRDWCRKNGIELQSVDKAILLQGLSESSGEAWENVLE